MNGIDAEEFWLWRGGLFFASPIRRNPEGCQTVAGDWSEAQISGRIPNKTHPVVVMPDDV